MEASKMGLARWAGKLVACAAMLAAPWSALAQSTMALYFQSQANDFIGQGSTLSAVSPQYTVTSVSVPLLGGGAIDFHIQGPVISTDTWDLELTPPVPATTFSVGSYANAIRSIAASLVTNTPGLDFGGSGRGCNQLTGRFDILEISMGPGDATNLYTVNSLAVNFEQHCEGHPPALFGQFRYNSSVPIVQGPGFGGGTAFGQGVFADQTGATPGAYVVSNAVTVGGLTGLPVMHVTGGEYSYNGGAFSTLDHYVQNGDSIAVRVKASRVLGGTATATVNIGGVPATFNVTTYAAPTTPSSSFYYSSATGDPVGAGQTKLFNVPQDATYAFIEDLGGDTAQMRIVIPPPPGGAGAGTWWQIYLQSPTHNHLQPGTYTGATLEPNTPNSGIPGINVSSTGTTGCSSAFGSFTVYEAVYNSDQTLAKFSADFTQHCNSATAPALYGEIRFNSTVGSTVKMAGGCVPGADTDGDGIPDCVEFDVSRDLNTKDNDVFNNAQLFVMQQYRDFLQREGDTGGITFWTQQLSTSASNRLAMVKSFIGSPEFGGTVAPVARLYFAYFLRVPDAGGLRFWSGQVQAGNSLQSVSDAFAGSPEFIATYGSLDNGQFVDLVYQNVLARAPDGPGRAFWKDQLDTAAMTRGQVMLSFSESAEFHNLIDNDVYVTMLYLSMLQRAPDSGGFAFWTGYLDAGNTPDTLINLFLTSPEYHNRFLP